MKLSSLNMGDSIALYGSQALPRALNAVKILGGGLQTDERAVKEIGLPIQQATCQNFYLFRLSQISLCLFWSNEYNISNFTEFSSKNSSIKVVQY